MSADATLAAARPSAWAKAAPLAAAALAAALFIGMDATVKTLTGRFDAVQLTFLRFASGSLYALALWGWFRTADAAARELAAARAAQRAAAGRAGGLVPQPEAAATGAGGGRGLHRADLHLAAGHAGPEGEAGPLDLGRAGAGRAGLRGIAVARAACADRCRQRRAHRRAGWPPWCRRCVMPAWWCWRGTRRSAMRCGPSCWCRTCCRSCCWPGRRRWAGRR